MTLLELVNEVLTRLREDEVRSWNETSYSRLITNFVNQIKRQVEVSWNWSQLRESFLIPTQEGVHAYQLPLGPESRIFRDSYGRPEVWNITKNGRMKGPMPQGWMTRNLLLGGSDRGSPIYFDINGRDSSSFYFEIFPIPDKEYEIQVDVVNPRRRLQENDEPLAVPWLPVVMGAYALSLADRGEDGGTSYVSAMEQYNSALSDAIALDAHNRPDELTVQVV